MLRRLAIIGLVAFAAIACKKSGPVVAEGKGFKITAEDFKARLQEQAPFLRARYNTPDHRKEFLDNMVRMEVLSREAERQGLKNDPEVQQKLKLWMIQKLVKKSYGDPGASAVPDADVQKYYDDHAGEFHHAKRVHPSIVLFAAAADNKPERAKKQAAARKALAALQAAAKEKKELELFHKLAAEVSDDEASKKKGGDIGFLGADEIEKTYSKELADALFAMKQGEISGVIETPKGYVLARMNIVQEGFDRTLEQVKPQIVQRLSAELKAKEFDEWVKKLEASAKVKVDEKALAAIDVGPAAGAPAMSQPAPKPGGDAAPAKQ
jgi:peptidyl-prolyl cis-trans isomerase C